MDSQQVKLLVDQTLNTVIVGKAAQTQDGGVCLRAGGHLLSEDVPGGGKTTLAHALARTFGLQFSRVQFTSDLMPSDLSGVSVYERAKEAFVFHPGPMFAQVLLADEINRASPKTQSALLEAMEEKQVTVEGQTRPLPQPFFVIATQTPIEQLGTYALTQAELQALQQRVLQVHAAAPLLDYLQDLIAATRNGRWFVQGLSPRAGIAVLRAARAQAMLAGRDYVAPDDIQAILPQTIAHRLVPLGNAGRGPVEQVRAMMDAVPLR